MTTHSATASQDQIAALAHKIWEDEGRPEGRAEIHWQRAAAELASTAKVAVSKPAVSKVAAKKPAKSKA